MSDGSSQAAPAATTTAAPSASPAAAVASQTNPGATGTTDTSGTGGTGTTTTTTTAPQRPEYVPEKFWDPEKGAVKTEDVLKSYTELEKTVGKPKFDVPAADTPPEQAAEFWKKLGVPETPDAYGLKPDANVPEHNNEANVAFLKAFGDTAHELKLSTAQATGMQKFFDDLTVNLSKEAAATQAAEDAQLDSLFEKALGADRTVAAERIKSLIEKVIPAEMRNLLTDKVSNEALTAIAIIEKHLRETYGQSDNNIGDEGGNASGNTLADLRKEAQDLYSTMIKNGLTHPDYKGNKEKYDNLYKRIGELTKAQK